MVAEFAYSTLDIKGGKVSSHVIMLQRCQRHTIDCSSDCGRNVANWATSCVWVKDSSSEEDVGGLADALSPNLQQSSHK